MGISEVIINILSTNITLKVIFVAFITVFLLIILTKEQLKVV